MAKPKLVPAPKSKFKQKLAEIERGRAEIERDRQLVAEMRASLERQLVTASEFRRGLERRREMLLEYLEKVVEDLKMSK